MVHEATVKSVGQAPNKISLDKEDWRTFQVEYDFGSNLEEAVELFGEKVVFTTFHQQAVVKLQDVIRRAAASFVDNEIVWASEDAVQEAASAWKPSVGRVKKTKEDKALELIQSLSPEAREIILASLGQ
jgi:hypothetical protein